ncbi:MAG: hypothetical protein IJJ33_14945 [Victivallales bacterium]|nr:hypothetical protein [Victivallales bacterium]
MRSKILATVLIAVAAIAANAQQKTVLYQASTIPSNTVVPALSTATPASHAGYRPLGVSLIQPVQYPDDSFDIRGLRLTLLGADHHNLYGVELGGFANFVRGDLEGLQLGIAWNQVDSNALGVQFAAIANYAGKHLKGAQLAVGANIARGIVQEPNRGLQLALVNISGDLAGVQFGVFNHAANIRGCQIGVVNFAESMTGCQLGLANVITNGALPFMVLFNCNF